MSGLNRRGGVGRHCTGRGWLVAAMVSAGACAHAPPLEFSERVRAGRCEDADSFLRAHRRGPPVESRVKQAVALPLSWALTGAAYTVEAVVVVGGGVVGTVVICSPIMAVEVVARGNGVASGECLATMGDAIFSDMTLPGAGRWVRKSTGGWRCADTTPISEDLRAIAECYAWRGGPGDLERAKQQLSALSAAKDVLRCASKEERRKVDALGAWLAERQAAGAPAVVP